jgi:hypothetical protein
MVAYVAVLFSSVIKGGEFQMGDVEIARLEERNYTTGGGAVAIVMLVPGIIVE